LLAAATHPRTPGQLIKGAGAQTVAAD